MVLVTKMSVPVTAKEKTNKKNDVKARSLVLMALSDEHQLTFSQYNDAKIIASSTESLDSIINRLQKIVSRLAILGVVISQEDLNSNFLSSLPPEWNTHVVVWTNKAEIETMRIDDLYNNFKIVEQNIKKSVGASRGYQNLDFVTALSTSSTNEVNTAKPAYEVSTVSLNVNTASSQVSTASFSDNAVYAFMVENPNGSNLLQQDLEQIHEDDLKAMDLKWQLSLLCMRAKRYYQRTGKKIFINANDTAGYDKSKVECFICHKMRHFAKKYRAPGNKEGQLRNQDNTRKHGNHKDTSSKVMLAIDGVGFDWSDMVEEQVQTNMALMAFSDSEVYNDKTCSKTCLKNYETLKKQCDDLIVKLNQTEFTAATYKRGLAIVEGQLITYRKNEVLFSEEVTVLKREVACKDYEINVLKSEFGKVKQKKEGIEFKIKKFNKALKDLNKLLVSQITDKSKKGLGYNVVPPPHPLIYNRPKKFDLSYYGLDEFKEPEFKSYGSENKQVSKDTSSFVESPLNVDKETVFLDKKIESIKPKKHEKLVKKSVRVNYNYTTKRTHPNAQRNMVPRAVLMKTGLKPFNTARTVNTAHPKSTVYSANPMSCFSKSAQSTVKRPFQPKTVLTNKRFTQKVNTAKAQAVNTTRPKTVKTARLNSAVVNAVRVNQENAVKASACWVWRSTKPDSASITLKKHNYINVRGRSKHMVSPFATSAAESSKDVEAFYAKELPISSSDPITSPAILTPSLILSQLLLFDPRYFFIPEELLPPKKQIHSPSSSSTMLSNSSQNQTYKMYLKHHEKQVEDILNYLDKLYLHHIEKMEEGRIDRMIIRRNSDELKTKLKKIRTQIIKLQKKQLGQKDKIAFAHYRISDLEQIIEKIQAPLTLTHATIEELVAHSIVVILKAQVAMMASTNNPNSEPRKTSAERNCAYEKFTSYQLSYFNGMDGAVGLIRWFKKTESIFSHSKCAEEDKVRFAVSTLTKEALSWWIQSIGIEEAYKITWSELKRLLIEKYCPQTKIKKMEEAITMTQKLIKHVMKHNYVQETNNHKRKFDNERNTTDNNNNCPDNHNNNHRNNNHHQQQNGRQEIFKANGNRGYTGNRPLCERCTLHHIGPCTVKCRTCNKIGHLTKNCRNKRPTTRNNLQTISVTCNACGKKGHYANQCSKANNRATGKHT
ncbi:putative ribonuclease H-like domain-containing protein [Tanacetum coccineum]